MTKKIISFEESLKRLQEISEILESNEATLEESIKLYEEGMLLSKKCYEELSKAELKVQELNKNFEEEII